MAFELKNHHQLPGYVRVPPGYGCEGSNLLLLPLRKEEHLSVQSDNFPIDIATSRSPMYQPSSTMLTSLRFFLLLSSRQSYCHPIKKVG